MIVNIPIHNFCGSKSTEFYKMSTFKVIICVLQLVSPFELISLLVVSNAIIFIVATSIVNIIVVNKIGRFNSIVHANKTSNSRFLHWITLLQLTRIH